VTDRERQQIVHLLRDNVRSHRDEANAQTTIAYVLERIAETIEREEHRALDLPRKP
jgi:hypothetical protein